MKHSFTSNSGHTLEVRESGRSVKLFLSINGTFKRIDYQPLKTSIVTTLLQEIIKLSKSEEHLREHLNQIVDGFDDSQSPI